MSGHSTKGAFNFAGSGDQLHMVVEAESFLSVCMSYHFDDLGGLTNWSRSSPPVSVLTLPVGFTLELANIQG